EARRDEAEVRGEAREALHPHLDEHREGEEAEDVPRGLVDLVARGRLLDAPDGDASRDADGERVEEEDPDRRDELREEIGRDAEAPVEPSRDAVVRLHHGASPRGCSLRWARRRRMVLTGGAAMLIRVHIVLIGSAIALAVLFGLRAFVVF